MQEPPTPIGTRRNFASGISCSKNCQDGFMILPNVIPSIACSILFLDYMKTKSHCFMTDGML